MKTKVSLILGILIISILIPACTTNKTKDNNVWLANPASVYCEENWWVLELVFESGEMIWICNFPDWSRCEERAYYRGECINEIKSEKLDIEQTDNKTWNEEIENSEININNIETITNETNDVNSDESDVNKENEQNENEKADINSDKNNTWKQKVDIDKLLEKCNPGQTWLTEWDIECMEDIINHYLPQ